MFWTLGIYDLHTWVFSTAVSSIFFLKYLWSDVWYLHAQQDGGICFLKFFYSMICLQASEANLLSLNKLHFLFPSHCFVEKVVFVTYNTNGFTECCFPNTFLLILGLLVMDPWTFWFGNNILPTCCVYLMGNVLMACLKTSVLWRSFT